MKQCDCYHTRQRVGYSYSPTTGQIVAAYDAEVGVCWGTKEADECSCGGDMAKCDFYAEVREKAKNANSNSWVIAENGCVITCPKCGERLELCYPDGTEVRYLPHCPYCGKALSKGD
jgi:hypothetical protein